MSRVKIEDLSVERTLGAGESQVRGGGGFRVSVGNGHNRLVINSGGNGGRRNFNQFHDHPHSDVYFHDTSHWDYVPSYYVWDCDHYDYIPGHWELHETGHFHH